MSAKTDEWLAWPLNPELFEHLAAIPEAERIGWRFPWRRKTGVYKWLRPLTRGLGVELTPHVGRHFAPQLAQRRVRPGCARSWAPSATPTPNPLSPTNPPIPT